VKTENISGEHQLKIWRDTTVVFNEILNTADTTAYDSALLPAHNYTYHAAIVKNSNNLVESQPLKITTMDTTSHDFTWELFTFGSSGSSVLYDVSIVNKDNIWAVGTIHTTETDTIDSLGNWIPPYNALHWDGQRWELKRILYQGGFWEINTVFAFSSTDIWFEAFVRWNGTNFIEMQIPGILIGHNISKVWGLASTDFYVVGSEGFIAHYNGSSWQKLESGTVLPIQDIWGDEDNEIYVIASTKYYGDDSKVFKIEHETVTEIPNTGLPWSISGLWFKSGLGYYIVGDGIYYSRSSPTMPSWKEIIPKITNYYSHAIKGKDINDLFLVGSYNTVVHFNGLTWKDYSNNELPNLGFHLQRVDFKDNIMAAIGYLGNKGIIILGERN
jgi:hypothetical protein